jgi:hypothetical protein
MQQANQPFHYTSADGVDHFVPKGHVVGDKDSVVKGREALFDTVPDLDKPRPRA